MTEDKRKKLKILLNYWMEHNREHSQEFEEWANKAKSFGEAQVSKEIIQAAREMDRVNKHLSRAMRIFEKQEC